MFNVAFTKWSAKYSSGELLPFPDQLLHDPSSIGTRRLKSCKLTQENGVASALVFEMARDHPLADTVKNAFLLGAVGVYASSGASIHKDDCIFVGRIIRVQKNGAGTYTVTCEGAERFLNDYIIYPRYFGIQEIPGTGTTLSNYLYDNYSNRAAPMYAGLVKSKGYLVKAIDEDVIGENHGKKVWLQVINPDLMQGQSTRVSTNELAYTTYWEWLKTIFQNHSDAYWRIYYETDSNNKNLYIKVEVYFGLDDLPSCDNEVKRGENLIDCSTDVDCADYYTAVVPVGPERDIQPGDYPSEINGITYNLGVSPHTLYYDALGYRRVHAGTATSSTIKFATNKNSLAITKYGCIERVSVHDSVVPDFTEDELLAIENAGLSDLNNDKLSYRACEARRIKEEVVKVGTELTNLGAVRLKSAHIKKKAVLNAVDLAALETTTAKKYWLVGKKVTINKNVFETSADIYGVVTKADIDCINPANSTYTIEADPDANIL